MTSSSLHEGQLTFLYQDEHLFVVDKPRALHCVPRNEADEQETLASTLLRSFPQLAAFPEGVREGGLVQRLDYYTNGCIMGAMNSESMTTLRNALKQAEVKKTYLAVVEGTLEETIELRNWIGSPYRRSKKMKVVNKAQQPKRFLKAESTLTPLAYNTVEDISLVEVHAHVARRHQVRAHCAFAGIPLLGDTIYGATRNFSELSAPGCTPITEGFSLTAFTLEVRHPVSHARICCRANVPDWMHRLFTGLQY